MYSEPYVPKYAPNRAFDYAGGYCKLRVLDASSAICNEYSEIERHYTTLGYGGMEGMGALELETRECIHSALGAHSESHL